METFIKKNEGQIFRFRAYRKTYTPYETSKAFIDESDTTEYELCKLIGATNLGCGDYLLELQTLYFDEVINENGEYEDKCVSTKTVYHRLSDVILEKFECDNSEDKT